MKQTAVTPTTSRLLASESIETYPKALSRMGVVKMVAQTVQDKALTITEISFFAGFGAFTNGRINRLCIRPESRIRPSVAAKESCRLRLAIAYGLTSSSKPSAANKEFKLSASRRVRNAPAAIRYITAARRTDGVPPAIGTKNTISGMETHVPMRLPSSR